MSERITADDDEWYSDEALAKQRALAEMSPDAPKRWSDIAGIFAPRVQPSADQRCHNCGSDARDEVGGDLHFCGLHIGRGYETPDDCPDDCARPTTDTDHGGGSADESEAGMGRGSHLPADLSHDETTEAEL